MIYNCISHIGKVRKNNEDYCKGEIIKSEFGSIGIFALADGMGGHNKGEVASKLAVENIISFLKENLLQDTSIKIDYVDDIIKQAYNNVNGIIHKKSIQDEKCQGMGTTLTIAIIYEDNLYAANVGDSRCYLFSNNTLKRITTDHSVVEELIKAKIITEKEAKTHPRRNHITRAMGTDEMVIVDIFKHKLDVGDKILLASDGLTGFVDDDEIKNIIQQSNNIEIASKNLVYIANEIYTKFLLAISILFDC